jgi:DNA-binding FadR family transcriptional regulator
MAAPARKSSSHALIVRELGQRIVSGKIAPNERLPSEAELGEQYGVSRSVLREATRVLTAKGLVSSRQRAGAVVRPRADWHLLDPDVLEWLIHAGPRGAFVETLMTVRRIFEPAAAALAARTASDEQLARIEQAYARMEAAQAPGELLDPDLDFHRLIAQATGNDLLAYIGNMLTHALRESIRLSSKLANTHELSLPRHKAIVVALRNRDALAARHASLVQLEETQEDLAIVLHKGRKSGRRA